MAFIGSEQTGNWIVESCTEHAPGAVTLTGADFGYARFRDTMPAGKAFYIITNGDNREAGVGDFDGTNILTRSEVRATLVAGVYTEGPSVPPITISGAATCACTFNSSAFDAIWAHVFNVGNPHDTSFLLLTDTPAGYQASRLLRQNAAGTGVESSGIQDLAAAVKLILTDSDFTIGDYTLPLTDGVVNHVLATDGAGNVTWQYAPGGSATFLTLVDTPASYTASRSLRQNSGATGLEDGSILDTASALKVTIADAGLTLDAYTIPWTDGAANQVLLTDGLGAVNWQTVSHLVLSDIGVNSHAQIDTHIADTNIHPDKTGAETVSGAWNFTTTPEAAGIQLTPAVAPAHSEGLIAYDSANNGFIGYIDIADVTLNIGEEEWIRVRNSSGALIPNGSVVYVSGTTGQKPTIELAIATSHDIAHVVGIATHDIANN
jgi:hypothetical protein